MPIFLNSFDNYFLITNYKVMYGTLCRQNKLVRISNRVAPFYFLADKILSKNRKKYLLVRNPYEKLISFYSHKILYNKLQNKEKDRNKSGINWQHCQKIFFPYLNISHNDEDYMIGQKLAALSFEKFVALLPDIYKLDQHLWPQFWSRHLRWKSIPIMPIKFHKIIPLENNSNSIRNELKIDMTIRENKTIHESHQKYFTTKAYEVVNKLYHKDFQYFGYKLIC